MKSEILHNDISWWINVDNEEEYRSLVEEDIEGFIRDGYSSGALSVYTRAGDITGGWNVVDWKSIACELYHAVDTNSLPKKQKALDLFDKNW